MPKTQLLICYNLNEALGNDILDHPNDVMLSMGIEFKSSAYDYLLDQWIFSGCSNTPQEIPSHLSIFKWSEC